MAPIRLQRKRQKGWRKPENSVIVDRTSRWGNPFRVVKRLDGTFDVITLAGIIYTMLLWNYKRDDEVTVFQTELEATEYAILLYKRKMFPYTYWKKDVMSFITERENRSEIEKQIAGKNVICFCHPDSPCHADVLLEEANRRYADHFVLIEACERGQLDIAKELINHNEYSRWSINLHKKRIKAIWQFLPSELKNYFREQFDDCKSSI